MKPTARIALAFLYGTVCAAAHDPPLEERVFESAADIDAWLESLLPRCAVGASQEYDQIRAMRVQWREADFREVVDRLWGEPQDERRREALGTFLYLNEAIWERHPWEGYRYLRDRVWEESLKEERPKDGDVLLLPAIVGREDMERVLRIFEQGSPAMPLRAFSVALHGGPAWQPGMQDTERMLRALRTRRSRRIPPDEFDRTTRRAVNIARLRVLLDAVEAAKDETDHAESVEQLKRFLQTTVTRTRDRDELPRLPLRGAVLADLSEMYRQWLVRPPRGLLAEGTLSGLLEAVQTVDTEWARSVYRAALQRSDLAEAPRLVGNAATFLSRYGDAQDKTLLDGAVDLLSARSARDPRAERLLVHMRQSVRLWERNAGRRADAEEAGQAQHTAGAPASRREANAVFASFRSATRQWDREQKRIRPQEYSCAMNLRRIASAKETVAQETGAAPGQTLTAENQATMRRVIVGGLPRCPQGGTYRLGAFGQPPSCSIHGNDGKERGGAMNIELIRTFFGWCTMINGAFLLLAFLFCVNAGDWIYRMHTRWFTIDRKAFTLALYGFMGGMKILFFMFNLVPYVALVLMK